jgi:hypothetical protein
MTLLAKANGIAAVLSLLLATVSQAQTKAGPAAIYPDSKLTPGKTNPDITNANIKTTICNKEWTGVNKFTHEEAKGTDILRPPTPITDNIKVQAMKNYGFTEAPDDYELDHFISLELGGCPDCIENLWPQPYGDAKHPMTEKERSDFNKANPRDKTVLPGSTQKDAVEDRLKEEICHNPQIITLERAQKIITTDWYACYLTIKAGRNSYCR